jgi:hypothetical protein
VFDRPLENLRARTEELRKKVEELLYRADADKWIITGGDAMGQVTLSGAVPFPEVTWSASAGAFLITEDIVVQPFMAPNTDLFASQDYVFGGAATFTFSLTAHTATPAIGPLRQDYQLANSARIIWEEALPGAISGGYCEAALEGSPEHILRITIRNDGLTQASNVVTALNLILAPTVTTSPFSYVLAGIGLTYVLLSDITGSTDVTLTSSYSRELHLIARTDVPMFFGSNPLADDGDGVGIWFEELVDSVATGRGGRRQATPLTYDDVLHSQPNTIVPVSKLFLFSATPEQIPGAIPLCRRIGTSLVFIDGTVVADGQTATFGGEGSIDTLRAEYDAHVAGTADKHPADDITFDDTNFNTAWSLNPSEVQEALDLVVGALTEESAGVSGASRVHNETIDTGSAHSETSAAGTLHAQVDDLAGWVGERAHKTAPELITGNWQRSFPAITNDYQQNIDISTRLDLSCHGGAWGSTVTYTDIARKYAATGHDVYWGNPKAGCNAYNGIAPANPIVGQCVCNLPQSAAYLTESGMLSRVLLSLGANGTIPRLFISDPLQETVLSPIDLRPYLPVGTWVSTALCAVTDTRIAAMFTDGSSSIVQVWDITDGVTLSLSVASGWGTGVVLPGSAGGSWVADAIIADIDGASLYTLNSGEASDQNHVISKIDIATHVVTASGRGDAASNPNIYAVGGLVCDTDNIYFTTLNRFSHAPELNSATKADLSVGVGGDLPLSLGNLDEEICCSLAFDGVNVYAPIMTPSSTSAALMIFDVVDKLASGYADPNYGGAGALLHGLLKNCCFDGVNLWIQEVQSGGQLVLWAIDVGAFDSTGGSWADVQPRSFPILRYSEIVTDSGVTYPLLGPIISDGSSVFTALESVNASSLCGQMRRVTRSCYR